MATPNTCKEAKQGGAFRWAFKRSGAREGKKGGWESNLLVKWASSRRAVQD